MTAAIVAFVWSGLSIAAALLLGAVVDLADRRRPKPEPAAQASDAA